jgi:hypothetical protein
MGGPEPEVTGHKDDHEERRYTYRRHAGKKTGHKQDEERRYTYISSCRQEKAHKQ